MGAPLRAPIGKLVAAAAKVPTVKVGGGRGRGGNSTKAKPYDQLTDGAKRGRRHKERKRNEKGQFITGPAPDNTTTGPADPLPEAAKDLPKTQEELDVLKKKEEIIKMRLENRRSERLSVERSEIEKDYIAFFDIMKEGLENLPAKYARLRPGATTDDTNALLTLGAEIIEDLRTFINGQQ